MRLLLVLSALLAVSGCKREAPPSEAAPMPAPQPAAPSPPAPAASAETLSDAGVRLVELAVTNDGFVPNQVALKAQVPVVLVVTRKTDETCARELTVDGTDLKVELPLGKAVEVPWTPTKAGKVKFGCAMDKMIGGVLLVE